MSKACQKLAAFSWGARCTMTSPRVVGGAAAKSLGDSKCLGTLAPGPHLVLLIPALPYSSQHVWRLFRSTLMRMDRTLRECPR